MHKIEGLEVHQKLYELMNKIERRIREGDAEDAGVNMRKAVEYITEQYACQYPNCEGSSLYETINNLKEERIIRKRECDILHKIRILGNEGGAHLGEASMADTEELFEEFMEYLPDFLDEFPDVLQRSVKVSKGRLHIDYSRVKPLEITAKDWWEQFKFWKAEYYDKGDIDGLGRDLCYTDLDEQERYSLLDFDWNPQEYIRYRDDKTYLDRYAMVQEYEGRITRLLRYRTSDEAWQDWGDNIVLPGVIQEYFGFHRIVKDFLMQEIHYSPLNASQILYEAAIFNHEIIIPELENMSWETYMNEDNYAPYPEINNDGHYNTKMLHSYVAVGQHLPIGKSAYFNLKKVTLPINFKPEDVHIIHQFPNAEIILPKNSKYLVKENGVFYTRDYKKLLYVPRDCKALELQEGLEEIGVWAFRCCDALRTITIPSTVKKIGEGAFQGCKQLQEIIFSASVPEIAQDAFDASMKKFL